MSQDVGTRTGGAAGQDTAPWLILGGIGTGFGLFAAAWFGGTVGVLAAGGGWAPPPFAFATAVTLVFRGGPGRVWPGHATAATVGITGADLTAFQACFKDQTTKAFVQGTNDSASKAGVNATPTVHVNGKDLPLQTIAGVKPDGLGDLIKQNA